MTSHAIPFLDADRIRRAVPIADLVDAVEDAFRAVATGRDQSPPRARVPLDAGDLLLMPGVVHGAPGVSVKLVTVVGDNPARGLPTVQAVVVWLEAATGRPLALIDGPTLTAMRTGAASGAATRLLARREASVLAVIGTGAQAEWQLRAVAAVRPIRRVAVYSRGADGRGRFAGRMAQATGLDVVAAESAEEAVRDADVVCCATTSETPVFDAAWLRPGAHVNGIGAYRLDMVEMPPELFGTAALVTVDSVEAARAEAGDLAAAVDRGLLEWSQVQLLGGVDRGWAAGRDERALTVFKSVGLAAQDVAAAGLIAGRLLGG